MTHLLVLIELSVPLGMLAARRCGMDSNAIAIHAEVLSKMKYHVKTGYRISETYYTATEKEPLYGTGQGQWGIPVRVAIYSSTAHERVGKTSTSTNPIHIT
jgi:hypothetical protein